MDSAMIGKIMKAKQYAEERERIRFSDFHIQFKGDHSDYVISYHEGRWQCNCHFFAQRGVCSHTMAMERVLGGMVTPALTPAEAA